MSSLTPPYARNDIVDVLDGEHDATEAQRVHRRVDGSKPDRVGRVELVQLDATVTIGRPHHREGGPHLKAVVPRRPALEAIL
jgi:hypothetical protein